MAPCETAKLDKVRTMPGSSTGRIVDSRLVDDADDDDDNDDDDGLYPTGSVVLRNSNILALASSRMQPSGGGAPRDPVASNTDFR